MRSAPAINSFTEIATLRIELIDSDPLIWREVEVPTSITLKVLHDIVQVTMGWLDYHLWEFVIATQRYGLPVEDDWCERPRKAASRTRLRDVLAPGPTEIEYTYDFGDNWQHRLVIGNVRRGDAGGAYPRFVDGQHAGPPEDCGGISGFYEMLEVLRDPAHADHAEISGWLDGFDPNALEVDLIEIALRRIAARRNAAAKRILKQVPG